MGIATPSFFFWWESECFLRPPHRTYVGFWGVSGFRASSISTFSTPPESFVSVHCQKALRTIAKPLKSLKKFSRLSVLAPLQNRPVKRSSAKTQGFPQATLPSQHSQGPRVDVPPCPSKNMFPEDALFLVTLHPAQSESECNAPDCQQCCCNRDFLI